MTEGQCDAPTPMGAPAPPSTADGVTHWAASPTACACFRASWVMALPKPKNSGEREAREPHMDAWSVSQRHHHHHQRPAGFGHNATSAPPTHDRRTCAHMFRQTPKRCQAHPCLGSTRAPALVARGSSHHSASTHRQSGHHSKSGRERTTRWTFEACMQETTHITHHTPHSPPQATTTFETRSTETVCVTARAAHRDTGDKEKR